MSYLCLSKEECMASTSTLPSNSGKLLAPAAALANHFCSEVVNLDNHHKDEKSEHPERVISSRMIVEEFGGIPKILASLYTNAKVSPTAC